MMAELEANKDAREGQESHIAELTQALTSSISQVKASVQTHVQNLVPEQLEKVADHQPQQCIGPWGPSRCWR